MLIVSAVGLVLIAAGMLLAKRSYDDRVERIESRLLEAATLGARVIDDFFESRTAILAATVETVGVVRGAEVAPLLEVAARAQPGFGGGIAWIDSEGFVRSRGSFDPEILSATPPGLLRGWRTQASRGPHVSEGIEGPAGDRFVLLGVPAGDQESGGHLVAAIRIDEVIDSLPPEIKAAGDLHVVGRAGRLLVEAGDEPVSARPVSTSLPAGITTDASLRGGTEVFRAVAVAPVANWTVVFERDRSSALRADMARMWGEIGILSALGISGALAASQARRRIDDRHDLLLRRGHELTVLEDLTESLSKAAGADAVIGAGLEVFDRHFWSDIAIVATMDVEAGSFRLAARDNAGSILGGSIGVDVPSMFLDAVAADRPIVGYAEAISLATGRVSVGGEDLGLAGATAIGFESGDTRGAVVLAATGAFPLPREDMRLLEAMVRVFGEALGRAAAGDRARYVSRIFQDAFRPRDMLGVKSPVQRSHWYVAGTESDDVGGDWYDLVPLSGGRVGLVVGDVVGRGIYAAAVMAQLRGTLRALLETFSTTTEILARVDGLSEQVPGAVGCAITVAIFDPADGRLEVGCAGHLPPLIVTGDEIRALTEARGVPIGVKARARRSATVRLGGDDTLLLYTDGLVERRGEGIDTGISRLMDALFLHRARSVHALTNALLEACRRPLMDADDCALVLLRNTSGPGEQNFSVLMSARREDVRGLWHDLRSWLARRDHTSRAGMDLVWSVSAAARAFATLEGTTEVGVEVGEGDGLHAEVYARNVRVSDVHWEQFGEWTSRIVEQSEADAVLEDSACGPVARFSARA